VGGTRPRIEMKKSLAEAEPLEAGGARRRRELRGNMARERHVEGKTFVQRERRAANAGVV